MRKSLVVMAVLFLGIYMFGCKKKEAAMEELQEPMTMEALSTMSASAPIAPEGKIPEAKTQMTAAGLTPAESLAVLPPTGPYKPTGTQIQTALKHAGFYDQEVDGKIGPKTRKAIEEFQKANGLKADGKVGPQTWGVLSSHLNLPVEPKTKKKR